MTSERTNARDTKMLNALIVATQMAEGPDPVPAALLRVCGISLLERQVRQLRNIGVRQITVLAPNDHPDLHNELNRLKRLKIEISFHPAGKRMEDASPETDWILTDGGSLIDFRLPELIQQSETEQVAVLPTSNLTGADAGHAIGIDWDDKPAVFAGCARLKWNRLSRILPDSENDWLKSLLSGIVRNGHRTAVDISALPGHIHDMRRDLPYYWLPGRTEADSRRGKALLIDASNKDVLDWPARYIHRPVENWMV